MPIDKLLELVMPQAWNELNAHQKATVAVQIYGFEGLQAEMVDHHAKQMVTVGHRTANIDIPLAGLIERLWQNGFETIACCQSTEDPQNPQAYIGFLSEEHGAAFFIEILNSYGIPYHRNDAQPVVQLPFGEVQLQAVATGFHPNQIPAVIAAINELTA